MRLGEMSASQLEIRIQILPSHSIYKTHEHLIDALVMPFPSGFQRMSSYEMLERLVFYCLEFLSLDQPLASSSLQFLLLRTEKKYAKKVD